MTIFKKDIITKQIEDWKKNTECLFKALETVIDQLKSPQKDEQEFQAGWIYENGVGNKFLIHHIWKDRRYPIIGSRINSQICEPTAYMKDGCYNDIIPNPKLNLILSTGRKWEPEI